MELLRVPFYFLALWLALAGPLMANPLALAQPSPQSLTVSPNVWQGMADPGCFAANSRGPCDQVEACVNELRNRDTEMCTTSPQNVVCEKANVRVTAISVTGRSEGSFYRDISYGVKWVVDNCKAQAAGQAPTCGGMCILFIFWTLTLFSRSEV